MGMVGHALVTTFPVSFLTMPLVFGVTWPLVVPWIMALARLALDSEESSSSLDTLVTFAA